MTPSEVVAKSLASLMVATWLDANKPTATSGEIVEIAAGHLATALDRYRDSIADAVNGVIRIELDMLKEGDDGDSTHKTDA